MTVAELRDLIGPTGERLDRAYARWVKTQGEVPPITLPPRARTSRPWCGPEHPIRLEAIRLLVEGRGLPDMEMRVAIRLGVTLSTVVRWRREARIPGRHPPRRRNQISSEQREEALRLMFTEGATIQQAAEVVGVSSTTIARWRREHREAQLWASRDIPTSND